MSEEAQHVGTVRPAALELMIPFRRWSRTWSPGQHTWSPGQPHLVARSAHLVARSAHLVATPLFF